MTFRAEELVAPRPSAAQLAFEWFQRVIAAYCMVSGALYWIRLVGLYEGSLWRVDLMPPHWQVACVVLAVLFPFAAIGLWMLASWGPVIWFVCAAAEVVMYAGLPQLFGRNDAALVLHLSTMLLYLAFRLVIFLQKRGQAA